MPNTTSYADVVRDWERLLSAAVDYGNEVPNAEPYRIELQKILTDIRVLKARQETATSDRQRSTQELEAMLVQGREVALQMRSAVRFNLGLKNELLSRFGVAPLRPRVRRLKTPTEVKPPAVKPPASTAEAVAKADDKPTTP